MWSELSGNTYFVIAVKFKNKPCLPGFTLYRKIILFSDVIASTCRLLIKGTSSLNSVNSWKCVAKRQGAFIFSAICLQI